MERVLRSELRTQDGMATIPTHMVSYTGVTLKPRPSGGIPDSTEKSGDNLYNMVYGVIQLFTVPT